VYEQRLSIKATRDLIEVVRAIYLSWQEQGVEDHRLNELIAVGRELREALELASRKALDAREQSAASRRAALATDQLRTVVERDQLGRAVLQEVIDRS
jgi:hypothetical protein